MFICSNAVPLFRVEQDHTQLRLLSDLILAVRANRSDLVRHLLVDKKVNARIRLQKTSILALAVEKNNATIVKMLLDHGVDVNDFCEKSLGTLETPLFSAVKYGHTEIVNMLLAYGADPNLADMENKSPLYMAIRANREEEATSLIFAGANMNTSDKQGTTPLQLAARSFGREVLLHLLLNHGANVHQADFKGRLATDLAAIANHWQAVQLLLDAGAKPGKVIMDRMELTKENQGMLMDLCVEKTFHSKRRILSLVNLSILQVRKNLILREKQMKAGRSIWKAIDELPIPEQLKLDAKIHIRFDGFDS